MLELMIMHQRDLHCYWPLFWTRLVLSLFYIFCSWVYVGARPKSFGFLLNYSEVRPTFHVHANHSFIIFIVQFISFYNSKFLQFLNLVYLYVYVRIFVYKCILSNLILSNNYYNSEKYKNYDYGYIKSLK